MRRFGLIAALMFLPGLVANAASAFVMQQDFSAQPRSLVICSFDYSVMSHDFADKQLKDVDWPGYHARDVTITEISRFRSATHVPTMIGPISTDLNLTALAREKSAREYGCPTDSNTVLLFGKDGTEKARWSDIVGRDTLFSLIDSMPYARQQALEKSAG